MIDRSQMPLWLAPSSLSSLALSRAKVTPALWSAQSKRTWSNAVQAKVAQSHHRVLTAERNPAAEVTACCSAIPTSKQRSGNVCSNSANPVGPSIATGDGHDIGVGPADLHHLGSECAGPGGATAGHRHTRIRLITPTPWNRSASSASAGA